VVVNVAYLQIAYRIGLGPGLIVRHPHQPIAMVPGVEGGRG